MLIWWYKIFGRFAARVDFADGSYIRPTSRESLGLFVGSRIIDIGLIYDRPKRQYLFYLPDDLNGTERMSVTAKVLEYGKRKRLRLQLG